MTGSVITQAADAVGLACALPDEHAALVAHHWESAGEALEAADDLDDGRREVLHDDPEPWDFGIMTQSILIFTV